LVLAMTPRSHSARSSALRTCMHQPSGSARNSPDNTFGRTSAYWLFGLYKYLCAITTAIRTSFMHSHKRNANYHISRTLKHFPLFIKVKEAAYARSFEFTRWSWKKTTAESLAGWTGACVARKREWARTHARLSSAFFFPAQYSNAFRSSGGTRRGLGCGCCGGRARRSSRRGGFGPGPGQGCAGRARRGCPCGLGCLSGAAPPLGRPSRCHPGRRPVGSGLPWRGRRRLARLLARRGAAAAPRPGPL
jgi:hypothetical protein